MVQAHEEGKSKKKYTVHCTNKYVMSSYSRLLANDIYHPEVQLARVYMTNEI